ncbi:transglycosylase SLT domain-containing protein [Candidatus Woesearchaeota archaeon]|nr:transglycosylase SLT domain-containing protein [Candidatus Woesearchaeota archaeon]
MKKLIKNKIAKGIVSLITIVILLSSILASSIFYENNITANVVKEASGAETARITIIEVNDIRELNQLNEGWYRIVNGYVFYLEHFDSYVPLYIHVRNIEQQNALLGIDEDGTIFFDNTFGNSDEFVEEQVIEQAEDEIAENQITGEVTGLEENQNNIIKSSSDPVTGFIPAYNPTTTRKVSVSYKPVPQQYEKFVKDAAKEYKINENLLKSLINVESGYNSKAKSPVGAVGLGQLMPATAKGLGLYVDPVLVKETSKLTPAEKSRKTQLELNPSVSDDERLDPQKNIFASARYLSDLYKKYNGDEVLIIAAYNAGEGKVTRFGNIPPYDETRKHVTAVLLGKEMFDNGLYVEETITATYEQPISLGVKDFSSGQLPIYNTKIFAQTKTGQKLIAQAAEPEHAPSIWARAGEFFGGIVDAGKRVVGIKPVPPPAPPKPAELYQDGDRVVQFIDGIGTVILTRKNGAWALGPIRYNDEEMQTLLKDGTYSYYETSDMSRLEFKETEFGYDFYVDKETQRGYVLVEGERGYQRFYLVTTDSETGKKSYSVDGGKYMLTISPPVRAPLELPPRPEPEQKEPEEISEEGPQVPSNFENGDKIVTKEGVTYTRETTNAGEIIWVPDKGCALVAGKDCTAIPEFSINTILGKGSVFIPVETPKEALPDFIIRSGGGLYRIDLGAGDVADASNTPEGNFEYKGLDGSEYLYNPREDKFFIKRDGKYIDINYKPEQPPVPPKINVKFTGSGFEILEEDGKLSYVTSDGFYYKAWENTNDGTYSVDVGGSEYRIDKDGQPKLVAKPAEAPLPQEGIPSAGRLLIDEKPQQTAVQKEFRWYNPFTWFGGEEISQPAETEQSQTQQIPIDLDARRKWFSNEIQSLERQYEEKRSLGAESDQTRDLEIRIGTLKNTAPPSEEYKKLAEASGVNLQELAQRFGPKSINELAVQDISDELLYNRLGSQFQRGGTTYELRINDKTKELQVYAKGAGEPVIDSALPTLLPNPTGQETPVPAPAAPTPEPDVEDVRAVSNPQQTEIEKKIAEMQQRAAEPVPDDVQQRIAGYEEGSGYLPRTAQAGGGSARASSLPQGSFTGVSSSGENLYLEWKNGAWYAKSCTKYGCGNTFNWNGEFKITPGMSNSFWGIPGSDEDYPKSHREVIKQLEGKSYEDGLKALQQYADAKKALGDTSVAVTLGSQDYNNFQKSSAPAPPASVPPPPGAGSASLPAVPPPPASSKGAVSTGTSIPEVNDINRVNVGRLTRVTGDPDVPDGLYYRECYACPMQQWTGSYINNDPKQPDFKPFDKLPYIATVTFSNGQKASQTIYASNLDEAKEIARVDYPGATVASRSATRSTSSASAATREWVAGTIGNQDYVTNGPERRPVPAGTDAGQYAAELNIMDKLKVDYAKFRSINGLQDDATALDAFKADRVAKGGDSQFIDQALQKSAKTQPSSANEVRQLRDESGNPIERWIVPGVKGSISTDELMNNKNYYEKYLRQQYSKNPSAPIYGLEGVDPNEQRIAREVFTIKSNDPNYMSALAASAEIYPDSKNLLTQIVLSKGKDSVAYKALDDNAKKDMDVHLYNNDLAKKAGVKYYPQNPDDTKFVSNDGYVVRVNEVSGKPVATKTDVKYQGAVGTQEQAANEKRAQAIQAAGLTETKDGRIVDPDTKFEYPKLDFDPATATWSVDKSVKTPPAQITLLDGRKISMDPGKYTTSDGFGIYRDATGTLYNQLGIVLTKGQVKTSKPFGKIDTEVSFDIVDGKIDANKPTGAKIAGYQISPETYAQLEGYLKAAGKEGNVVWKDEQGPRFTQANPLIVTNGKDIFAVSYGFKEGQDGITGAGTVINSNFKNGLPLSIKTTSEDGKITITEIKEFKEIEIKGPDGKITKELVYEVKSWTMIDQDFALPNQKIPLISTKEYEVNKDGKQISDKYTILSKNAITGEPIIISIVDGNDKYKIEFIKSDGTPVGFFEGTVPMYKNGQPLTNEQLQELQQKNPALYSKLRENTKLHDQYKSQRFFAEVERVLTEFQGLGYYATLFFDEDSLLAWRDNVDRMFATLYLGTEYWSSAICSQYLDGENDGIAYAETPQGLAQVGAHIEATRSEPIITPEGTEFNYRITFNVRNGDYDKDPRAPEEMHVNVILRGERAVTVFKEEQKVKRGSSFGRIGRNAIAKASTAFYNEVCLTFDNTPLRWKVSNNEVCNIIQESSGAATTVSTPASAPASGGGAGTAPPGDINDF